MRSLASALSFALTLAAGCSGTSATVDPPGDAARDGGTTGSDGGATADSGDPRADAASTGTARPLGAIANVQANQPCGGGGGAANGCTTMTVTCPGIEDATAVLRLNEPTGAGGPKGTIFAHLGAGGTGFYTRNVPELMAAGFRVVQVRWESDWEKTRSSGILAAGCRPATVMAWIHANVHKADRATAYCAVGHSGGSGAIAYALAHYGMESVLDFAELTAGPPFGRIDYGCAPQTYTGPPRALCADLADAPMALPGRTMDDWENTTTCGSATPLPADLAKWTADSVVSAGADYDYPRTVVALFNCTINPNGTTGGAFFYGQRITSAHAQTCFTQCAGEDLGTAGWAAALQAVIADCKPRH